MHPARPEAGIATPAASDLDIFLDGGFIPSHPNRSFDGPIWPPDSDAQDMFDEFAAVGLARAYHLPSAVAVRREISKPFAEMTRYDEGVFDWLDDKLMMSRLMARTLATDPGDLHAAYNDAYLEYVIHGPAAAVKLLARTSGRTARQRMKMYNDPASPGRLEGLRCQALLDLGRLDEAQRACALAQQLDKWSGRRTMVKVLLAQGKVTQALAQIAALSKDKARGGSPQTTFTYAVALEAAGRSADAHALIERGLHQWPTHPLLRLAAEKPLTVAEAEAAERGMVQDEMAQLLANCGHNYLDLALPDRAETCFREADALHPGPAEAERLVHAGETDPEVALGHLSDADRKSSDPLVKAAVAWLYDRSGDPAHARPIVASVADQLPLNKKVMTVMWQVCGDLKDWPCLLKYRGILGLDSHLPSVTVPRTPAPDADGPAK